jgi:putative transposase
MASRKYRSLEEWQALIDEQSQSGLGVAEFCKQHGLTPKYFYRKRRQLRDGKALVPTQSAFVQVSPGSFPEKPVNRGLSLQYRECQLQIPPTTDPAWLAQLLQSL